MTCSDSTDSSCSSGGNVRLPSIYYGDTWDGISSIEILVDGVSPTNPVVSARMQFRKTANSSTVGHELTSAVEIIIVDDVNWEFNIPAQELPLTVGSWVWDFETTDSIGTVKTYLNGSISIKQDVTR